MTKASVGRSLDRVIDGTTFLGGIAVVLMMVHITLDIVLRFFAIPLPGTMSIVSYYYMLVVTFVSLAFAERRNAHISVEIVYDLLPTWMQAFSRVVGALLCLAIFGLMAMKSWDIAMEKLAIQAKFIQGGSVIVTWPGYFLLPLGFALMWLTCLMKLLRVFVDAPVDPADQDPVEAVIND